MFHVRNLPPVSGSIIWSKQVRKPLDFLNHPLFAQIDRQLGKGWANQVKGQKLKADSDSVRAKLNTQVLLLISPLISLIQEIYDDWARKIQQRDLGVSGRIFVIVNIRARSGRGNQYKLKVGGS